MSGGLPGGPERHDHPTRAVRRAAAATGLATGLLWAVALTDRWTGPPTTVLTLAAAALPVALAPVAIRLFAHPRATALAPQARRTAVAGLTRALTCVVIGIVALTVAGRPADHRALLALTVLTGLATAVAALVTGELYRTRATSRASRHPGPSVCPRPDLFDDLALLSARAMPGSPAARALAWANRGLDRWPWSPRRRTLRPRPRLARAIPQPE